MSVSEVSAEMARRPRVLVVDDAPIFREIETVFLGRTATVLTANDGTSALALARREHPDLVVTDLSMRQMDGDELCRELRRDPDLKHVPVIVVTSGKSPEEHERAVRAGASDVVEKPIRRVSLLQSVNCFLRPVPRSQPRATLETDVVLSVDGESCPARSRNVSRGGLFVETDRTFAPDTELRVEFDTPDGHQLAPTARVAWRRPPSSEESQGMGLQFLKIDPGALAWLDDYVYEYSPTEMLADPVPA